MLLIEDNPTDIFVIRAIVGTCDLDLDLRILRNGNDALLYFENLAMDATASCPALILLDLNLPKVEGIEVLRKLRTGSRCGHTPVIIVTSSVAEADRHAVQLLGAEAYFQKSTSLAEYAELAELIKRFILPPA